jgi:hypothetical protein
LCDNCMEQLNSGFCKYSIHNYKISTL